MDSPTNIRGDHRGFGQEALKDTLDGGLKVGKILLYRADDVLTANIGGGDDGQGGLQLLSHLRLVDGDGLCQIGEGDQRKSHRQHGDEEHIVDSDSDDTARYHKEQSRRASHRELLFFTRLLQGSSHALHLHKDSVLLFLASRRQRLVFEGHLFTPQVVHILVDLFGGQLQECKGGHHKQDEADDIECSHTLSSFLSKRFNSSCGMPPRISLARRDSEGLFSWTNSPTMWKCPSTYSLLWIL